MSGERRNRKRERDRDQRRAEAPRLNAIGNLGGLHGNYGHRPKSPVVAAAIAAGLTHYIGADCAAGHGGKRFVKTNGCCECNRLRKLAWRRANSAAHVAEAMDWARRNPAKRQAISRAYAAMRRAKRKNATPIWLTAEQKAELTTFWKNCPEGMSVDHIVPLTSDKVCGLHVPWNLQYLDASTNIRKGNRYWENDWRNQ